AFIIVLLSVPALIRISYLKDLVDKPGNLRKLHMRSIPTIGGIIIFAGTLFSYFLWYPFNDIHEYDHLIEAINDFKYIGAAMLILFFVGVKDDIIGTAPVKKLVGHLIVAFILVFMANIRITSMHGLFGITDINLWSSIFLSLFTYTVIVNAFNLIDGVDGLAPGVGAIVCIAFGIWFYLAGGIDNACLSFALAGSLIAFLFFNFSPARIFMGDSGALIVGLIISVLSIKLVEFDKGELPVYLKGISRPVFAMSVLVYPLVDTMRIFTYRAIKGISPFKADNNHIHHRLINIGCTHRWTVVIIYLYTISIIALTLFLPFGPNESFIISASVAVVLAQLPFFFRKKSLKSRRIPKFQEFEFPEREKISQN
ncbi:MAG: glycosyltransferase family 4 protein, partial [Flavobacteriales bacterium]